MSDRPTPETDALVLQKKAKGFIEHARNLERQRDALRERVRRLEEAGDAMWFDDDAGHAWTKAKEAKP